MDCVEHHRLPLRVEGTSIIKITSNEKVHFKKIIKENIYRYDASGLAAMNET